MKLLRFGTIGLEKPGILDGQGNIRNLGGLIDDISNETLSPEMLKKLKNTDISELPIIPPETRIGASVGKVGKFICIGLNYREHVKEARAQMPDEPILFMKATSAIAGPNDDISLPRGSLKTDWEVELGVVVGRSGKYIDEKNALDHIAGYTLINDLSEREYQLERGGQWVKGKSADGFGPIGPWLVTKDEIPDPQKLDLWLDVNGCRFQSGNTGDMIFGVEFLISYISQFMTLHPGDVISTGTPVGVGMGQKPPKYLAPGDTIKLGISGLGLQHQKVLPL